MAVVPGGPQKDVVLMDILKSDERLSEYEVDDGSQIRLKTVVTEIWRVENEYDADGNPLYVVKAQGMMSVIAPDNLKQ